MKKRILSVLLGCSLLFGTIFANAVSIEFEDMEISHIDADDSIIYEEVNIDENSFSSEATNETINEDEISVKTMSTEYKNLFSERESEENNIAVFSENNILSFDSNSLMGYFTKADNITYKGNSSITSQNILVYNNSSIDNSKYVIYSNAVSTNEKKYDLIIYPFKGSKDANVVNSVTPFLYRISSGYGCYKLLITEHGNINHPISMNVLFGISDLDDGEYVILPFNYSEIHKGIYLTKSTSNSPQGIKYIGNKESNTSEEQFNTNCTFGEINIPSDGITIYYGYNFSSCGATLAFDAIKNYIDNNAYTIQFSSNGGTGNIPVSITKYGNNIFAGIGNIGNTVPTRIGYTFKGWSAIPELNEKRVAYDIGNTGAVQTSSSWTYENYCHYTGGDSSNRTLTLYAQWEVNQYPVTYIDVDTNGNEIGRTTKSVDYDTFVKGSDIGDDKTDNAYYPQYRYVSDTSTKVTTDGAVVYRVFEFCETEAKSNLKWNDNNNADGFRPNKYKLKLKQNGKIINEVELPSDETNYTFLSLPKYDSNGNAYKYTFDVDASNRYQIDFDEDGNLIVEDYLPANFSVTIPKTIVLDGNRGTADYTISVNGMFYYNDTLTVIPESSLTLTDRNKISSMRADVLQQKTVFMKEDGVSSGTTANGSIQVNKTHFAGSWKGHFNFEIKFEMQN